MWPHDHCAINPAKIADRSSSHESPAQEGFAATMLSPRTVCAKKCLDALRRSMSGRTVWLPRSRVLHREMRRLAARRMRAVALAFD